MRRILAAFGLFAALSLTGGGVAAVGVQALSAVSACSSCNSFLDTAATYHDVAIRVVANTYHDVAIQLVGTYHDV